ncbi:hypothetical protein MJD09_05080 [bacterium]|nr:hypothetical protein [bacterium]
MSEGFDSKNNEPLSRTERDRIDLQSELAGLETGRPKRFLSPELRKALSPEERRRERDRMSALYALLQRDPEYAALYEHVSDLLDNASHAAAMALADANASIDQTASDLNDVMEGASTLPDGTKVFRSADGKAYTEDGHQLTDDEKATVTWKVGAPGYEELLAKKQAHRKALEEREAILRYQREVLDPARRRMDDPDNRPSKEDLEKIGDGIKKDMPSSIQRHLSAAADESLDAYPQDGGDVSLRRSPSAASRILGDQDGKAGRIASEFDRVRKPEPDQLDPSKIVLADPEPDQTDAGPSADTGAADQPVTRPV